MIIKSGIAADKPRLVGITPDRPALSLADQAYKKIRRAIINCELVPGHEISETELAEDLEMSKTPVREALAKLQFDGFVRTIPRRGYQILPITMKDINELFDLRIVIEQGAVDMLIDRYDADVVEELDSLANAKSEDFLLDDMDYQSTVNFRFHTGLSAASGNERLHRLAVQNLTELERVYYLEARADDSYQGAHVTHPMIVEAIQTKDKELARHQVADHIDSSRRLLLKVLTDTSSKAPFRPY